MTLRPIRIFGDPILNTRAEPIDVVDQRVETLVSDMLETMDHARGVGLAANQIGLAKRVFVYDCDGVRGALINPEWAPVGDTVQVGPEGCLSIPNIHADVARYDTVIARGVDVRGRPVVIRANGLLARCIQHETDHLDGILYLRRLDSDLRKEVMEIIRGMDWFTAHNGSAQVAGGADHNDF